MAHPEYPKLYKEARLDLDSDFRSIRIHVSLPGKGLLRSRGRRATITRATLRDTTEAQAFATESLSHAGGIVSHRYHRQPQRILWRLNRSNRVVHLSAADVLREGSGTKAAPCTIAIEFPGPIQPESISFVDHPDSERFDLFALSSEHEIYNIQILPGFFHDPASIPTQTSDWCTIHSPGTFSFRYPHRLVACDYSHVLISLHDAGILLLRRPANGGSGPWTESYFNEGGWTSSIRSFIPWQGNHVVKYGGLQLEQGTAVSMAYLPDRKHIFAITLDHNLKAWNTSSGKISAMADMLSQEGEAHQDMMGKIDPAQTHLLEFLDEIDQFERAVPGRSFRLITFSPVVGGQFKFWRVDSLSSGELVLVDLYPKQTLEPQAPSAEAWTVRDFQIAPVERAGVFDLWVLWKSAQIYRVHRIRIDLAEPALNWTAWVTVGEEAWRTEPTSATDDPRNPSEKWIQYMSEPGRIGLQTLATAARVLIPGLKLKKLPSSRRQILESYARSMPTIFDRSKQDVLEEVRDWSAVEEQWRKLLRIALELERQRWEAVALTVDWLTGMPAVVTTDGLTLIRDCSPVELLADNLSQEPSTDLSSSAAAQSRLIAVLFQWANFLDGFAGDFRAKKEELMAGCLRQDSQVSPYGQLIEMNDQLTDAVTDQDYRQLLSALTNTHQLNILSRATSEGVLQIMRSPSATVAHRQLTTFGEFALSHVIKERLSIEHTLLESMLLLVVLMDQGEETMSLDFDLDREHLFAELTSLLRQNALMRLLSASSVPEASDAITQASDQPEPSAQGTFSLLQDIAISHHKFALPESQILGDHSHHGALSKVNPVVTGASLLTSFATQIIAQLAKIDEPDLACSVVSFLLHRDHLSLANQFAVFLPHTSWAEYLRARLLIADKQYATALQLLCRAAQGLSRIQESQWRAMIEGHRAHGQPQAGELGLRGYYLHVAELFSTESAHERVAESLELALRSGEGSSATTASDTILLTKLFDAYLQARLFDSAYTALVRWKGPDRSALRNLVEQLTTVMYREDEAERLLSYPFVGLVGLLDDLISVQASKDHGTTGWALVLYSWRLKRNDIRGAAEALWEHIVRARSDPNNGVSMAKPLLLLINVLSISDAQQGWILGHQPSLDGKKGERRLMGVKEVRKMYQEELDKLDEEHRGDFDFIVPMDSREKVNGMMELDVLS